MRCALLLLSVFVGGCAPELELEPAPVQTTRQAITLFPSFPGTSDGGLMGTTVIACAPNLLAATEPGAGFLWFSMPSRLPALAARRRSSAIACEGERVYSVGDAGVERVTSTGTSYPTSLAGNALAIFGTQLVIAAPSTINEYDLVTGIPLSRILPNGSASGPSAVAATATHLYVGREAAQELVVINRIGGVAVTQSALASFGAVLVTGDFSPDLGQELAIGYLGGVQVRKSDGTVLWDLPQPAGNPQVPSLATASRWLDRNTLGQLDALLVGYSNLETVFLYLGAESVDSFVPTTPGGQFGAGLSSAGGLIFVGAPQHLGRGAVYASSLPSPPWSSVTIEKCGAATCGSFECFGGVACVSRTTVDAGTSSDGGTIAPSDGGTDAGNTDAGTIDAGTIDAGSIDAGSIDAGLTLDAGARDAGVDAGTSQVDAGVSTNDAGTDQGALTAAGCTCSESNGLVFIISAVLLARRRRR